jgi:hypothetical protein
MPDQQSEQDNQPEPQQHNGQEDDQRPEPQQHDGQVVPQPPPDIDAMIQVAILGVYATSNTILNLIAPLYYCIPYHTSSLSGAAWVQELLAGHPRRIRNELGVCRGTFIMLVRAIQALGLQPSRHVSIEEQLAIFLYTVVTGLTCIHVGERFQRSPTTITK